MSNQTKEDSMKPIILCGGEGGRCLIYGRVESDPVPGEPVTLHRARMVIYYPFGGTFGLAAEGPPHGSRITSEVSETVETKWQEWIAVDDDAASKFDAW